MNWRWLAREKSPPREEGWPRHQENAAQPPLMERTGWSLTRHVGVSDHPVCADKEASRHFLTGAATSPYKGGDYTRPAHRTEQTTLICFILILFTLSLRAEVLDRIVAIVDGQIITLSNVRQEREIRSLLGESPINDDVTLSKQLIDANLIERQIADYPNIEVTEAEVDTEIKKVKIVKVNAPGREALADGDSGRILEVSPSGVRDAVRRRIRIQKFFDMKFRQFIDPSADEIRKYYEEVFVPEAKARGAQSIPPLSDPDMTNGIRMNVIQENLDHEVDVWLEAIRRRSSIELFQ